MRTCGPQLMRWCRPRIDGWLASDTGAGARNSVFRRMIDPIDNDDVDRASREFQFQSKLFLQRREDRRSVRIDVQRRRVGRTLRQDVRRPFQLEVEEPDEMRAIGDG